MTFSMLDMNTIGGSIAGHAFFATRLSGLDLRRRPPVTKHSVSNDKVHCVMAISEEIEKTAYFSHDMSLSVEELYGVVEDEIF
ncbi:hypothetical protein [Mesorhizobium sp.]|uniref:hypothetical protein n=1 Tax=Mesorhizobium sp. TaxID=1871066 RepID=UPI00257BB257|nr:hypothetical protein [Mesorhizobium sp.]